MFFVDVSELKGRIVAEGKNITSLSGEMGIRRETLSRYLKKPESITYATMNKLIQLLDMSESEAKSVFLRQNLAHAQKSCSQNVAQKDSRDAPV